MTNSADLRNNTMSAAMRASIGQHLATTTVLDHATAWRIAGDILVMCPQLLESPGMRGHLTEDEKNEQSSLANWDAMLYGHSFMVDGVRVDPRRVVVGMSAASRPEPVTATEQGDALNSAVQRAASELPDGYTITVEIERGYGGVSWCNPDGEQCDEYHSDILAEDVIDALADAKQDAAIAAGALPCIESEAA